jgi:tetratricopeptide (TPR) repeat protein
MRRAALIMLVSLLALAGGLLADARGQIGRLLLSAGFPSVAAELIEAPTWRGAALYEAGRWQEAAAAFAQADGPARDYNRGNALARAGRLSEAVAAYDAALAADPDDDDARANRALVAALLAKADAFGTSDGLAEGGASLERRSRGEQPSDQKSDTTAQGDGAAGDREAGSAAETAGTGRVARTGQAQRQSSESGDGSARGSASDAAGAGRTGEGNASVARLGATAPFQPLPKSFGTQKIEATEQWLATLRDDPGAFLKLRMAHEQTKRQAAGTAVPPGDDPW